jgi:hypothetical protein
MMPELEINYLLFYLLFTAFMGGLSTALYRLIVPARHAKYVKNLRVDKIFAPAKFSLIFT